MNNKIIEPVNSPEDRLLTKKKNLALAISAALCATPTAFAQENVLEEVIVTATKRKSNMQDLPQAITAFTTDDILRQGFAVLDDYAGRAFPATRR